MSDLEHVIQSFKLSKAGGDIPAEYDPKLWLKVYDMEEDNVPATITNITRCPDNNIAIEFKYDGYTRTKIDADCYFMDDEVDEELSLNDSNLEHTLEQVSFNEIFITEYRMRQFKDKLWPTRLKQKRVVSIHLEYAETVDATHANYKIMCDYIKDGIITLSREDIREYYDNAEKFLENICYLVWAMRDNVDGFNEMFDKIDDYSFYREEELDQDET